MQESAHQLTKRLKKELKKYLKDKFVLDIFLFGSSVKEKLSPRDIDLVILVREKDYKKTEDLLYNIKNSLSIKNLHIEHLIIDDFLEKSISSSIIHEGISLRHNKRVTEMLGYEAFALFTFSLDNLTNVDKVRFAQTLYGRKNDGLVQKDKGRALGKGSFIVPIEKQNLFLDVLTKFKVKYKAERV